MVNEPELPEQIPPANFEDALRLIEQIVSELEEGRVGLEESLPRFEQGIGLLRQCYGFLERAEQRIELLTGLDPQGNPLTAPFDATATADPPAKATSKPVRRTRERCRRSPTSPAADEPEADSSTDRRTVGCRS